MLSSTTRRIHRAVRRRTVRIPSKLSSTTTKQAAAAAAATTQESASTFRYSLPIASLLSLTFGVVAGRESFRTKEDEERIKKRLSGDPLDHAGVSTASAATTGCDDKQLTPEQEELLATLRRIVGRSNCFDGREENAETTKYRKGARIGFGTALAIVRPYKLIQVQQIVEAAADAGCAVLVQGSNTGLTGGSTPRKQSDGRPTVIISMKNFDTIFPIDNGEKVVCLAGVGISSLRNYVLKHFGRESHSILGSACLNPTTAAGVAFGSGSGDMRKGPAFTERALYLKVEADKYGKHIVKVVNTLGIEGLDSEEGEFTSNKRLNGIIRKLDKYIDTVKYEQDNQMKKSNGTYGKEPSHDHTYKENLCRLDNGISRFNGDTKGLDCNRSEGKVLILATVHTTFQSPPKAKCFWVSFADLGTAERFKQQVILNNPADLPMTCEYIGRDSFDIIDRGGRLSGHIVKFFGLSSSVLRKLWEFKNRFELPDKVLYFVNPVIPSLLPKKILEMGRSHDHNISTIVGDYDGSLNRFEERLAKFRDENKGKIEYYECQTSSEMNAVTVFRFMAAPAFKTFCVGTGLQGVNVDYALPKNYKGAPVLPPAYQPVRRMRHSHFGCNVIHESLLYEQGVDIHKAKMELKHVVDNVCKGSLPAEHGHGTEYIALEETMKRWQKMDPMNVMNPGVGGSSTKYGYAAD